MKLVILDRDGVINEDSDAYIRSPEEMRFIAGSLEAIARFSQAGFVVAVATNQSGVGRGYFDLDRLNAMHAKLQRGVAALGGHIEVIAFCPHLPEVGCRCRKPLPGLLEQIGERLRCPLADVPVIGDSARDLEAARSVGARPILVLTGKGAATRERGVGIEGAAVYADLAQAAEEIINTP